jgi:hypothetical protein
MAMSKTEFYVAFFSQTMHKQTKIVAKIKSWFKNSFNANLISHKTHSWYNESEILDEFRYYTNYVQKTFFKAFKLIFRHTLTATFIISQ